MFMRKIRNFLYFFICSFHLNCPTTEEQITDRQVLLGVTQKVSSNSKHTLLCLCGHNVFARIKPNTIENTAVVRPSGWRRKASKERLVFRYVQMMKQINPEEWGTQNTIPRDEQKCIPACHTFYMSYDKNVKRMASMHICLHISMYGYFLIKLQLYFHTTVNLYVNKSIRPQITEASKMRPFLAKSICSSVELQDNGCQ